MRTKTMRSRPRWRLLFCSVAVISCVGTDSGGASLTMEYWSVMGAHFRMALPSLSIARFNGHEKPQDSLADHIGASSGTGALPPLKAFTSSARQIRSFATAVVAFPYV